MQTANGFAFKEWAAVCAALEEGRQSVILRKGGIHEGGDGFRVEHSEFWLFPTRFHQEPEELVDEARGLIERAAGRQSPAGMIGISLYAVVEEVLHVADESLLPMLAGWHVLSPRVVSERFHYRTPGLFVLPVRIYRLLYPVHLPDSPHFAGCKSWVDFPVELPTSGLKPVLADQEHRERMSRLRAALAKVRTV